MVIGKITTDKSDASHGHSAIAGFLVLNSVKAMKAN